MSEPTRYPHAGFGDGMTVFTIPSANRTVAVIIDGPNGRTRIELTQMDAATLARDLIDTASLIG